LYGDASCHVLPRSIIDDVLSLDTRIKENWKGGPHKKERDRDVLEK
jgi:hypothetical protein